VCSSSECIVVRVCVVVHVCVIVRACVVVHVCFHVQTRLVPIRNICNLVGNSLKKESARVDTKYRYLYMSVH
jgi:hypothetical protein